jgi:HlyD family secretion protein
MPRQVRGLGKLVPEETLVIPAEIDGRVEKKLLEPGARVNPNTVVMELSNARLIQDTTSAEWDWRTAETAYKDFKARQSSEGMSRQAERAGLESNFLRAELEYTAKKQLVADGLVPELDLKLKKTEVDQLRNRLEIEKKREDISKVTDAAQLEMENTKVNKAKAMYDLRKSELDQLKVRAGVRGVLQSIAVDVGQQVSRGIKLAVIVNPDRLKAELNIPETQAKDVQIGQEVSVDIRTGNNSIIPGKVVRIDPAAKEGTVTIDVTLLGELPKGSRPDLSVDGTILIERLENIVYVAHPVQGGQDSQVGLFKLTPDGKRAIRVPVKLGRSSVNSIEVKEGLKPGDTVILSDMSEHDDVDAISLK